MQSFRNIILTCFILIFFAVANAQASITDDLASPVTTPAKTILWIGTGTVAALLFSQTKIEYPFQDQTAKKQPLGKYSKYGDYAGQLIPNALYAGGMLLAGALGNKNAYKRSEIMVLGTLYSGAVATVLKYTVREQRPNDSNDRKSFPSGHATSAFAFASVVGAEHELYYAIPAYGLATFVGYSRINDNKHYLHDVVAGATIGASYGLGIHYLRRGVGHKSISFLPIIENKTYGLLAELRL